LDQSKLTNAALEFRVRKKYKKVEVDFFSNFKIEMDRNRLFTIKVEIFRTLVELNSLFDSLLITVAYFENSNSKKSKIFKKLERCNEKSKENLEIWKKKFENLKILVSAWKYIRLYLYTPAVKIISEIHYVV